MSGEIATAAAAPEHPPGDYAIVELFGHTTLVGRIEEVERFGSKMLSIEPIFNDQLLSPILHGGAAIYRLTSCGPAIAFARQARHGYQLPPAIRAIMPDVLLPAPSEPASGVLPSDFDDPDEGPYR